MSFESLKYVAKFAEIVYTIQPNCFSDNKSSKSVSVAFISLIWFYANFSKSVESNNFMTKATHDYLGGARGEGVSGNARGYSHSKPYSFSLFELRHWAISHNECLLCI